MSSWPRSLALRTVGAGDVSLARAADRGLDAGDVTRALHAAIEQGIDLVEVAPEPDTEHLAGDALRSLRARDRVLLATRVTAIVERSGAPTRDVLPERLPSRYVQDRVESSLRATRLEVLPLVQLELRPAYRTSSAWPELVDTCARLVREGKVLAWGAYVDRVVADEAPVIEQPRGDEMFLIGLPKPAAAAPAPDATARLLDEPWLASINTPFNLCERAAESLVAPAREKEVAILARRPLAGGALAGELGPGVKLKPDDDRRAIDARTLERIAVGAAKLAAFTKREPPAARSCDAAKLQLERNVRSEDVVASTVAELALRYVLDRGAIAMPRLHRREHVADALAVTSAPPLAHALDIDL
ncbi:MAG: hypothetical protein HOV81_22295, partial [Kofleriaceae bacterium]|nr:hypothetical protein [Kofleriaceae bacterium]